MLWWHKWRAAGRPVAFAGIQQKNGVPDSSDKICPVFDAHASECLLDGVGTGQRLRRSVRILLKLCAIISLDRTVPRAGNVRSASHLIDVCVR